MDMKKKLLNVLTRHVAADEANVFYYEAQNGMDMQSLFSYFVFRGDLIEKDQDENIFVGTIKTKGLFAKKRAYVAAHLENDTLYMVVYANDGPTNQEICQEVADRLLHM